MKIRILLIDDSPETLETLSLLYASHPAFEVVGAIQTASEAVDFLKNRVVDLVSIDIQLDCDSGFQLCTYVHDRYPDVFITMCSVEADAHNRTLAYQKGAHHFLAKPLTGRDIDDLVVQYAEFKYRCFDRDIQKKHDEAWIDQIIATVSDKPDR